MIKFRLISLVIFVLTGFLVACDDNKDSHDLTQAEKAVAVLKSLESGDSEVITSYISSDTYIQHNLAGSDGRQALFDKLPVFTANGVTVDIQRVFTQGNYVFTHSEYNFFGPKIGFDVFRFENGKIVEHWDNLQEITTETASGHSMIDGPTEVKDLNKTETNIALVRNFVHDILMGENMGGMAEYFDGDKYIQHNPNVPDGVSGLLAALSAMQEQGISMIYEKLHFVHGEGNFVLSMSEGSFAGEHVAFYDMFRINNGFIAEHWDVIQLIPPEAEWANSNGKF